MTWEDIAKKLRLRDLAAAHRALQELVKLGDPALFDAALEGVYWGERGYNKGFHGGPFAVDNADALVCALLPAALPLSERARALAAAAEDLTIRRGENKALIPHLASFTGLRSLTVRDAPVADLSFLAAMPRLTSLELELTRAPRIEPLYALQPLEYLSLTAPDAHRWRLAGLPARGRLSLSGGRVADLRGLPPLRGLLLSRVGEMADTVTLPEGLERLDVSACPDLASLGGLPAAVALTRLQIQRCPALRRIGEPCSLPALADVYLHDCDALTSLVGLPGGPAVTRLSLSENSALPNLIGLPMMEALTSLDVYGHAALASLDGLPALPALEEIKLQRCAALVDLRGLLQPPRLSRVDLSHCSGPLDPAPLLESPTIRAIGLHESGIKRQQIPPAHRHRFTWASSPDLKALEKHLPPAPVVKQERRTLSQLRSLLASRDRAVVAQGLELLRAAGEPAWFDALLGGASYETGWKNLLKGGPFAGHMKPYGMTGLLALAPPESAAAAALRSQITSLNLKGMRADPERPLSPRFLAALESLAELSLERLGPVLDESPRWPQLKKLEISELLQTEGLGWLSGATGLRELTLRRLRSVDLAGLAGASALERLALSRCGSTSLSGLAGHPSLRALSIQDRRGPVSGAEALGTVATLEALRAHGGLGLADLGVLAGCPLRELALSDVSPLTGLSRLEGLRVLSLQGVPPAIFAEAPDTLDSLTASAPLPVLLPLLARQRQLTWLSLTLRGEVLDDMPQTSGPLRVLQIHEGVLRSLAGIAAHPTLEKVYLTVAPGADLAPLLALPALTYASLTGASRQDVRPLEERGVQVGVR